MFRHLINAKRETNSLSRLPAKETQIGRKKERPIAGPQAAINSNKSDKVEGVGAECDMDCIKGYDWGELIKPRHLTN